MEPQRERNPPKTEGRMLQKAARTEGKRPCWMQNARNVDAGYLPSPKPPLHVKLPGTVAQAICGTGAEGSVSPKVGPFRDPEIPSTRGCWEPSRGGARTSAE